MRGLRNKFRNWRRLGPSAGWITTDPGAVRFDRMEPIVREPFQPDDDAIIATNGVEIGFFLEKNGCDAGKSNAPTAT